jgi:hypothetical protein
MTVQREHTECRRPQRSRRLRNCPLVVVAASVVIVIACIAGCDPQTSPSAASSAPGEASTEESATPTPPPAPPKVYTGKGDNVLKIDKAAGPAVMTFSCAKCSGNTIVQSDGAESLLVNTIGSYTGKRALDVSDGSTTTRLTIKATGSWKVAVGGLDQAKQATGTAPVTGKGDDVIMLSGSTTTAAITNKGQANFIVQTNPADGGIPDVAVNEIGSYTGTVPLAAPALVQVTSEGSWSVTPQP